MFDAVKLSVLAATYTLVASLATFAASAVLLIQKTYIGASWPSLSRILDVSLPLVPVGVMAAAPVFVLVRMLLHLAKIRNYSAFAAGGALIGFVAPTVLWGFSISDQLILASIGAVAGYVYAILERRLLRAAAA